MSLDDFADMTPREATEVVAPNGQVRGTVQAMFAGSTIFVDDQMADIRVDDQLRRKLPNGNDEVFVVTDPRFYNDPEFGPHYQIKFRRAGVEPARGGGNYTINVSGNNARANINSTDNSINVVNEAMLDEVRRAIERGVADIETRAAMLSSVAEMKIAKDKPSLLKGYQALVSSAKDHVAVIVPFLPALTKLLSA